MITTRAEIEAAIREALAKSEQASEAARGYPSFWRQKRVADLCVESGREAIEVLPSDLDEVLCLVREAAWHERRLGDDPVWGPIARAIEAAIPVVRAAEASA